MESWFKTLENESKMVHRKMKPNLGDAIPKWHVPVHRKMKLSIKGKYKQSQECVETSKKIWVKAKWASLKAHNKEEKTKE